MAGLQFLALLCIGSLFALTGLRQFFIDPLPAANINVIWFGLQVLPLVAVLPGVLRRHGRGFFYAALTALLYFVHGVLATSAGQQALGLAETGLSIGLLAVAFFALRRMPRGSGGETP